MSPLPAKPRVPQDFALARSAKDDYWVELKRAQGPALGVRVSDELRRQVQAIRPDWPRPEDREDDLRAHSRLAELLRRAAPHRTR